MQFCQTDGIDYVYGVEPLAAAGGQDASAAASTSWTRGQRLMRFGYGSSFLNAGGGWPRKDHLNPHIN